MKFFFPDSQDLVDPSFDFEKETRSVDRLRQRDDLYAHELFSEVPYDGLLVSKGCVDGMVGGPGRYTLGQRHRLLREGAHEFFRTGNHPIPIMGDCGAFSYVREKQPPFSVDDVISFYEACQFDLGIAVDHAILAFNKDWDTPAGRGNAQAQEMKQRQEITLELAREFLRQTRKKKVCFEPLGVAQGWSPKSYAKSVAQLQKMGYDYIAVGGMVPLKDHEIIESLEAISAVRHAKTRLHLLGVTRTAHILGFGKRGVASFDSTSPLRQAFKDSDDNYYALDTAYTAIRVPQVEGNPKLQRRIQAGIVPQAEARHLEKASLDALQRFADNKCSVRSVVKVVHEYEQLFDPGRDNRAAYARVLEDSPWRDCQCDICKNIGHHVVLFRGAERNRRRGLHNVWVFRRRLDRALSARPARKAKAPAFRARAG